MNARLLVLLVLLTACKRDRGAFGALRDADVTIIEEGAGPENAGPLEPATAGFSASVGDQWQRWAGPVDAGKDDVLAKDLSGGNRPMAPTIGSGVGLYRFTDDGLVIHALDAPLDDQALPILMVPETVRVGMIWESEYGDGDVNRMEVAAHQEVMLPTGPAEAWAIHEYASDGTVAITRWYAEGIGRIGTGYGEIDWSAELGYGDLIVPLDAQDHHEPALEPAALAQVIAIDAHGENGHEVWGLSGAVFDGVLYAYMDGLDPAIGYTPDTPHDYCARLDGDPQWVAAGTDAGCPTHTIEVVDPFTGLMHLEDVLVDNAAMILPGVDAVIELNSAGAVSGSTVSGWVVDGVVHTLIGGGDSFSERAEIGEHPIPLELRNEITTRGVFTAGNLSTVGQLWLGQARADAGAPIHFAVVHPDGRVFRVTVADGAISGYVPVGILPGAVSVLLDGDERIAHSITADGRLFEARVDVDTGEVEITGLGWVRVEEPGGAYEFKGALVDPTHPGDVYVAAIATSATSVPVHRTGLFRARLEVDPEPVVTAPSLLVGAAEIDGGIAVCWAPSDEPFDGSGWTLRGVPVDVVGPVGAEGNCALFGYETGASEAAWVGADRAIEATIPGAGRVRLGFPAGRSSRLAMFGSVAVRPDGLVVDVKGVVLDRNGFPISRDFTDITSSTTAWPHDLGGYGLWTWPGTDTQYTEIENIGGGIPQPPCPSEVLWETCYYAGPVVGGGMLLASPLPSKLLQVVRPDGTIEDLPEAQGGGGGVLLEDGRICGIDRFPYEVVCVDRDGLIETTGPLPTGVQFMNDQWWPLSDGSLMMCNTPDYGASLRFDPETMTLTELDPRGITHPVTSPDGHVYASAQAADGTTHLVEVFPEGVVDLLAIPGPSAVVPVDGALLFEGLHGWERTPR